MKIKGIGSAPPPPPVEDVGGPSAVGETPAADAPSALGAADAVSPRGVVEPALAQEIAAGVRSGAITPEQAIERLVDNAIDRIGGSLGPEQCVELRRVLVEAVAADPLLGGKLRGMAPAAEP